MILPVANSVLVHQDTKHHLKHCHHIHQLLTTVDCCCYNQDKQWHDNFLEMVVVLHVQVL